MITTFNELTQTLKLTPAMKDKSQLSGLEKWCNDMISQDRRHQGQASDRYQYYYHLAQRYLDDFIPEAQDNPAQIREKFGKMSAIHYAAIQGYDRFISQQSSISKELINEADALGMTPLHHSAALGYLHTVKALLKQGANPHQLNQLNQPAIISALMVPFLHEPDLIERKSAAFLELFPLTPEVINFEDDAGNNLLHLLASKPFSKLAIDILTLNPDLMYHANNAGRYPIHTAILNHEAETIKHLLKHHKVSSLSDPEGLQSLHYAARYGNEPIIKYCYEASINTASKDREGKTALDWAILANNQQAIDYLSKH